MNVIVYGLTVAVIGIAVVFVGLIILIACIMGLSVLIRKISERGQKSVETPAPTPAPVAPVAPVVEEADEEVDDPELIAVIAAAIAAFDDSGKGLVVRKVRRVNGWNRAARAEQVVRF